MLATSATHFERVAIQSSKKAVVVDRTIRDCLAWRIRQGCNVRSEELEFGRELRGQDR